MKNKKGFTLAEVLITLTIIGVVAALTIPSLLSSVSDKTYEAKRKGLQTRLAQAISQMDSLNSYEDRTDPDANSSMNFVVEGLSKAYKISNVCEFQSFTACDFPTSINWWHTSTKTLTKNTPSFSKLHSKMTKAAMGGVDSQAVAFKTKNGESILLWYNPKCIPEQTMGEDVQEKNLVREICVHLRYDLDGAKKGPNAWGKDVGYMTILYPDTPFLVSPMAIYHIFGSYPSYSSDPGATTAEKLCQGLDNQDGFPKGSWILPAKEELIATTLNYGHTWDSWTSTIEGADGDDYGWVIGGDLTAKKILRSRSWKTECLIKDSKQN